MCLAVALSFSRYGFSDDSKIIAFARRLSSRRRLILVLIGSGTLLGCVAVAGLIHWPVPRVHDEFSYLLMSDTLVHGHVANPAPPFQFFNTFHVLVHPVYASKYFPVQGLFLARGQMLTGHPALGIWLGSALACAVTCWMLAGGPF